ncbi:MAG: hypothetical protein N2746_08585 [Deltaproteobacteria bacterium]|nr:hypothetical protein [Deltaproteobacteria bacterium]
MRRSVIKIVFLASILVTPTMTFSYSYFEDISKASLERLLKIYPEAKVVYKSHVKIPSLIYNIGIEVQNEYEVRGFIHDNLNLFGLDSSHTQLSLYRSNFFDGFTVHRYQQMFDGIEVDGGEIVVLLKGNRIIQISNSTYQIDNPSFTFNYSTEAARSIVLNHLKPSVYNERSLEVKKSFLELGDGIYPVYKVYIESYVPVSSFIYYVDARNGSIIQRISRMFNAMGSVYEDSPEKSGSTTKVTLTNLASSTVLQGYYVDTFSNCDPRYGCSENSRQARADSNGNFMFSPNEAAATSNNPYDPFAEVMNFYHINRAHDWYKSKGINAMDFKLEAAVNVTRLGTEMQCNAAYIGGAFIVGLCLGSNPYNVSKKNVNIAYDADVMMHEYTHAFIDRTSGLYGGLDSYGYNGIPLGLNEGTADFIPSHITDDEVIGRHLSVAFGEGAVRNLNDYARCPENIVGESHEDGKVFAGPTWLARRYLSGDDNFGKVVALAMASISRTATLQDAANAVISSARNIGGNSMAEQVIKAYEERNLLNCGRFVDVPNGYTASGWTLMPQLSGVNGKQPFVIQFVYDVPSYAQSISVDMNAINLQTGADATSRVTFYVNYNNYVRYSSSGTTATYKWVNSPTQTINNPKPGKYYMLAVGDGYGLYQFAFTFTYKGPPPTVASIVPDSGRQGETIPEVIVKGTNFQQGAKIYLGPNTNVQTTLFIDANTLKGQNVRIGALAATGKRNVVVNNPDGQQGVGTGLFTVLPANPADAGVDVGIDSGADVGPDTGRDIGFDIGIDIGFDSGLSDVGMDITTDTFRTDIGYDAGRDAITDTYIQPDTIIINDSGADVPLSKDVKINDVLQEGCKCDETYGCDPDCECDPECQDGVNENVVEGGCSCSVIN